MPFEIVQNDIANMQVDAVVNTANPNPVIGSGVDSGIHNKAGHELLLARQKIGRIEFGDAVITPGFKLDAKYVIHTVGPIWEDGNHKEEQILSSCYRKSLALAKEHECESIAFPLIATGNYGFPKPLALQIAVREISAFLLKNEMQIYLVVFGKEAFALSEKLFKSVSSYIDENYIRSKTLDEYGVEKVYGSHLETRRIREQLKCSDRIHDDVCLPQASECLDMPVGAAAPMDADDWGQLLANRMRQFGKMYPNAGYGGMFRQWLRNPECQAYNSFGNGSAMRVSSVAWLYNDMDAVRHAARLSAEVTHNHPEGIKGAEATASAIFLARAGHSKTEIKKYIEREFGYELNRTCDEIRPVYFHTETCMETVPEAITAFLEGDSFEDVIRTAVSLGGDCDTLTAIAGSIAEGYYGVPDELKEECYKRLPDPLLNVLKTFEEYLDRDAN